MRRAFFAILACLLTLGSPRAFLSVRAEEAPNYTEGIALAKLKNSGKTLAVRTSGESVLETVTRLRALPDVAVAEPDYHYQMTATPNDPDYRRQWYLPAAKFPEAWEFSKGSPAITVAVIDSGVDISHPDLRDRVWTNTAEIPGNGVDDDHNGYVDDVHGWDFVDNDADPDPVLGAGGSVEGTHHGTVVSGVVGASGNNNEGIAGAGWNLNLMTLRALDSQGTGSTVGVERAIRYAIAKKAKVINFSFIGPDYSTILASAIRDAYKAGIIIVAAAGNEGDTAAGGNLNEHPRYPVCYKGEANEPILIGVASVDATGKRSSFSNYGDCVSLSAPGENYWGTQVYRPGVLDFNKPYGGGWSGTSLAAPLVAGAAALMASMSPNISPKQVRETLMAHATDISAQNPTFTAALGAGELDAGAAVQATQEAVLAGGDGGIVAPAITVTAPNGGETFLSGQSVSASWIWQGSQVRTVRLTYVPSQGAEAVVRDGLDPGAGAANWVVPNASSAETATLQAAAIAMDGSVLASDSSESFTVLPPGVILPPPTPSNGHDYDPVTEKASVTTIDADKGLTGPGRPECPDGSRIRSVSLTTVWYCGADGKRYAFTDAKSYFSWYPDFSGVRMVSDAVMASVPFGGAVTYRPGTRMLKVQSSPQVYVVAKGGVLRAVSDEAMATDLYGTFWNRSIDDISDAFLSLYRVGSPVH